jgi:hypothetical protein
MTNVGNERLRELLVEFRDRFKTPAAGAAVVTRSGSPETSVVGNRRRRGADPVTIEDQWHLGSCTKAFTAVLYARLVDRGCRRVAAGHSQGSCQVEAFSRDCHLDGLLAGSAADRGRRCRR